MSYEYRVVLPDKSVSSGAALELWLSGFAASGWRLVTVYIGMFIFEREL